jgi:hypothetical protein
VIFHSGSFTGGKAFEFGAGHKDSTTCRQLGVAQLIYGSRIVKYRRRIIDLSGVGEGRSVGSGVLIVNEKTSGMAWCSVMEEERE